MPRKDRTEVPPVLPAMGSVDPAPAQSVPLVAPEVLEEAQGGDEEFPLFPESSEASAIAVFRLQPADGYLGQLEPAANEEDIRSRWGGGVFELKLRDSQGRVKRGGVRRIKIGGDPTKAPGVPAAQQAQEKEQDYRDDYVRLVRAEADAAITRRERENELILQRQKAEADQALARMNAQFSQQVEQQRQLHEQQLERDRQRMDAEAARAREHQAAMLQLQQQQTQLVVEAMRSQRQDGMSPKEVLDLVRTGIELAGDRHTEDPAVAMTKAVSDGIGHMVTLAEHDPSSPRVPRRLERGPGPGPAPGPRGRPQLQRQAPNPAPAPGRQPGTASPLEQKIEKVGQLLAAKGLDPERVLDALIDGELALVPTSEVLDEDQDLGEDEPAGGPLGSSADPGAEPGGAAPAPLVDGAGDHGTPHDAQPRRAAPARGKSARA